MDYKEYKLYYNYKTYKSSKTVNDKIKLKIQIEKNEIETKQKKATSKEAVLLILQEKYPNTIIEHEEKYNSRSGYLKHNPGYYTQHYIVTFKNGLKLNIKYHEDSSMQLPVIMNLNSFDIDNVINYITNIAQLSITEK